MMGEDLRIADFNGGKYFFSFVRIFFSTHRKYGSSLQSLTNHGKTGSQVEACCSLFTVSLATCNAISSRPFKASLLVLLDEELEETAISSLSFSLSVMAFSVVLSWSVDFMSETTFIPFCRRCRCRSGCSVVDLSARYSHPLCKEKQVSRSAEKSYQTLSCIRNGLRCSACRMKCRLCLCETKY